MEMNPPAAFVIPGPPVRRAIVLAHFDPQGCFDPHVVHALAAYRQLADRIVLVSNSARTLSPQLRPFVDTFVPRANVGYDFGAWREGLTRLVPGEHDEVICVNDSVYGPLFELRPALADARVAGADLWGMVLSDLNTSRSVPRIPHLQSWFLGLRRPLLESDAYAEFWRDVGRRPRSGKLSSGWKSASQPGWPRQAFGSPGFTTPPPRAGSASARSGLTSRRDSRAAVGDCCEKAAALLTTRPNSARGGSGIQACPT